MDKIVFNETIWQPVNGFTLKEVIDPVTKKVEGVIIEGEALDCSLPTRNGVIYDQAATEATHKMLEGRPMLINHDEAILPIGHVESVWMKGPKMMYRSNLDPEEKDLIRKIKRGDISNVSIQTLVEEISPEEGMDGKTYTRAYPSDWAELSAVTIPGYANSSMKLAEAFKGKKLREDITTSNSSALQTKVLAKTIRAVPEPGDFIKKDEEQKNWKDEALGALDAVQVIEDLEKINGGF